MECSPETGVAAPDAMLSSNGYANGPNRPVSELQLDLRESIELPRAYGSDGGSKNSSDCPGTAELYIGLGLLEIGKETVDPAGGDPPEGRGDCAECGVIDRSGGGTVRPAIPSGDGGVVSAASCAGWSSSGGVTMRGPVASNAMIHYWRLYN